MRCPIALATIAQMFIITVNDLDLSIGPFVGLVSCIGATCCSTILSLGLLALLALIVAYGAVGALIHLRNLPSIVVTLGLSFVWLGIAVLILPSPGGKAPDWLKAHHDACRRPGCPSPSSPPSSSASRSIWR